MVPVTEWNSIIKETPIATPSPDEGENYVYNSLQEGESTDKDFEKLKKAMLSAT